MVSFELGKEIERDRDFRLVKSEGQRKDLSTQEESNLRSSSLFHRLLDQLLSSPIFSLVNDRFLFPVIYL